MFLLGWGLFAVVAALRESSAGERAVVKGASAVNVRSGPGTGHRAFTTLAEGDEVEVLRVDGVWAVVRTPDGREGYVRKDYVALGPALAPRAAATGDAGEAPSGSREAGTGHEESEESIAEAMPMQEPTDAAQPTRLTGALDGQDDIRRLIHMTEELHRMVAELGNHRQRGGGAATKPSAFSGGWGHVVSALLGAFIGAAYGRARERRRRTRVRF